MLSGCRVLEICDETGALAGRILADLGADVVKVEPPGGDRAARCGPFEGGVEDPERSLAWLEANAGKRGITLDCERPEGRSVLARLLGRSDVLLETLAPGTLEHWGLGPAALERQHPRLVRCSITPFGQTGPWAAHRAGALVLAALAGELTRGGVDEAPLPGAGFDAGRVAAPEAALGVVLALLARERDGRGGLVDVSLHECRRSAQAHAREARPAWDAAAARTHGGRRAPRIGEHGREVLGEAGFGDAEIARLVAGGIV